MKDLDAIAVLETPIALHPENPNGTIYGLLYNQEEEKEYEQRCGSSRIREYFSFHYGIAKWLKNGGEVHDNFYNWFLPNGNIIYGYTPVSHFFEVLFKDDVNYKELEAGEPIQYNKDEIDDDEPRMVVNPSLIDRYKKKLGKDE
ncbi:MAG: hypothetical protein NC036_01980 [Muribaculaceae bacterium]|nr:hypothetical protein [Muribaculaceae bacterium]